MNWRSALLGAVFVVVLSGLSLFLGWWIGRRDADKPAPAAKSAPPATVKQVAKEAEFNTIVLTPEAERRLGIETAAIERKRVQRTRTFGGEIMIPPGRSVAVAAPMAGVLKAPPNGIPAPGEQVKKGQLLFSLLPLLTPEARTTLAASLVDAEGQVKNSQVQLEAARIALDRAKRLLSNDAGSRRAVDEAQAQFDLAQKNQEAAEARRKLLARAVSDVDGGAIAHLNIEAPQEGLLRTVNAAAGQSVPSGTVLFEVADLRSLWVRVGVYVGDAASIARDSEAVVGDLAGGATAAKRVVKPVAAPPSASPTATSVDLFYGLDNADGSFKPGQRVGVTLPLRDDAESLIVPYAAVLHDIHGNTWVYEQTAPQTFVRRRVQVRYVFQGLAVLASGPKRGTRVVTAGAAELYGTELGFAK